MKGWSSHPNQFQQFARTVLPSVAAQNGRREVGLLLPSGLSASTLYNVQTQSHSMGGAPIFGSCGLAPVHCGRGAGDVFRAGCAVFGGHCRLTDLPVNLGRLRSAHFSDRVLADGRGCRPCVATAFKSLRERAFQYVSEASPHHSSAPFRYGTNRSEGTPNAVHENHEAGSSHDR